MITNTGGREKFEKSDEYCIITLDGRVSKEVYTVQGDYDNPIKADRKGHIILLEKGNNRELKVHARRVLPIIAQNRVIIIKTEDRYHGICPKCGDVFNVVSPTDKINCLKCEEEFLTYYTGEKPMSDEEKVVAEGETTEVKAKKPPKEKKEKIVREPIMLDFDAITSHENLELWTKSSIEFDHAGIDVKAHVLIFTGDNPRKMCFNSYNGTLGKKSGPLPINEFVADEPIVGAKKEKPWFVVKDLEKEQTKLAANGYSK